MALTLFQQQGLIGEFPAFGLPPLIGPVPRGG
jgi:hypothetical protein